jgi:3-dehydroquinate synthase
MMNVSSQVIFTKNIAIDLEQYLRQWLDNKQYKNIFVLVDENTRKHCYPILDKIFSQSQVIEIPSGELNKNIHTCGQIWGQLTDFKADRNSLLINLGGGVIGDMGGFCAATYKRGIDFIQIPTTLLAQVDASIGGKLGVDFQGFKNQIGVFQYPKYVFLDIGFLQTLPQRQLISGFAEILKHCLIADLKKWKEISRKSIAQQDWADLVVHSVGIKSEIVAQDPKETGLRKILNFGHTLGHALETYLLEIPERQVLHGEAIAFGMIVESFISFQKNLISKTELSEITAVIQHFFGKIDISKTEFEKIIELAHQDKKNTSQQIRLVLLESIGKASYDHSVSPETLQQSLEYYANSYDFEK